MDGSSSDILVEVVKQPRQVWNCRGFGNLCTGKELGELVQVKDNDPSVVFIAETWIDKARLDGYNTTLILNTRGWWSVATEVGN